MSRLITSVKLWSLCVLQVRVIVERLARRCGFDALSRHWPASEVKLLAAIRKQHSRKERRRASASGGSAMEVDGEEAEGRSRAGGSARSAVTRDSLAATARRSEWGHSKIFDDDEDEDEPPAGGRMQVRDPVAAGAL